MLKSSRCLIGTPLQVEFYWSAERHKSGNCKNNKTTKTKVKQVKNKSNHRGNSGEAGNTGRKNIHNKLCRMLSVF